MTRIRVYELAKELGLPAREVIQRLARAGIHVKSTISWVHEASARAALSQTEASEIELRTGADPQAEVEPSSAVREPVPEIESNRLLAEGQPPQEEISSPLPGGDEVVVESEPTPPPPPSETSTEPLPEAERPQVDVHPQEAPVIEETAAVEERAVPVTAEPVLPTKRPEVKEPISPTASKVVKIPEMMTVKELGEGLATKPGKIIKRLKKMGIVATLNQILDPDIASRVATELGFDVEVTRVEDPTKLWQDMADSDVGEAERPDDTFADQDRAPSDDLPERIKQGRVRLKVRWEEEEQDHHPSSSPAPAIATGTAPESAWRLPSTRSPALPLPKVLWLLVGSVVTMILLPLAVPHEKGTSSPGATATSIDKGERVAAIPPPKAPPRPSARPRGWKIIRHFPRAGQTGQSRRGAIRIFFNRPVKHYVVEKAFSIFPHAPGTFSWPRADVLFFTPRDRLLPVTQYTVSLTPISGSQPEGEYTLLGTRWSFTTGVARTYRKDIKPIIAASCDECHGPAVGVPLGTYDDVSRYVVPGRADKSPLYTFIRERRHYIKMAGHFTDEKLAIIREWINGDEAAE